MGRDTRIVLWVIVLLLAGMGAAEAVDCEAWANSSLVEPKDVAEACGSNYVPITNPKATSRGIGDPAWAQDIGYISDDFITFPLADMTSHTVVAATANVYYGMDFDTAATTLYGITDAGVLGEVSTTDGSFTSLVTITGASDTIGGFAIDPTDETFYISTVTTLYTLDTVTGVATQVGPMGTGGSGVVALAIDSNGQMYAHDIFDDNIYTINKATGASTLVGSTGFDANYAQGMDFDLSDDTLYAWIYTGSGTGNFCSIDTSTGAATALSWDDGEWEGAIEVPGGPPRIAYVGHDGSDTCASDPTNDNGVWEPGESITIPIDVRGGGAFTGVTGTLVSTTAGVSIVTGSATWPDLAAGVSTTSNAPHFVVQLAETVPCLDMLNFELTLNSNEGGPWTYSFSHLVGQPLEPVVPVDIPDDGGPGSPGISTLTVADDVSITDLNIHVVVSHTWVGDVTLELVSPSGTSVMLLDRPGVPAGTVGCSDNNLDITFDDAAVTTAADLESYCAGTDPWYSGEAQAIDLLSAFNGESTAGVWELIATDNAGGDSGQIVDWELLTTPAVGGVCNVCAFAATNADLRLAKGATNSGGGTAVYTLQASNLGPDDATGVVVTDTLPAGVTYVGNDCGATFADPTLTWTIGSLLNGDLVRCNISVTVDDIADSTNTATISGSVTDPDPNNDEASAAIPELASAIPTINASGMTIMILLLAGLGIFVMRRLS